MMAENRQTVAEADQRHRIPASEYQEWLLFALLVGHNLLLFGVFTFWPLVYNALLSLTHLDMLAPVKVWVGLSNNIASR
jgi:ABC-type sugar transport system permease subunit